MKRVVCLVVVVSIACAGCAGTDTNKTDVCQPSDENKSGSASRAEITKLEKGKSEDTSLQEHKKLLDRIAKLEAAKEPQSEEITRLKKQYLKQANDIENAKERKKELLIGDANTVTVLTKPIFGIHLGENIADVQKRLKLTGTGRLPGSDDPSEYWLVIPPPANTKYVQLYTFEDRVTYILIDLIDSSDMNFTVIEELLGQIYKVETPDLSGLVDKEDVFRTSVEGVPVTIKLSRKGKLISRVQLTYIHQPLWEKSLKGPYHRKADKIRGDL